MDIYRNLSNLLNVYKPFFHLDLMIICIAICCMSYLVSFCYCVFSPFSFAIISLGEERANLSAFSTFVRFVLVWICRFPLLLGVWEGLRFVIVALPGLYSYLFYHLLGRSLLGSY